MRIIIIRHGDPDYEKDCLTELGHKQAAVAAKRLLEEIRGINDPMIFYRRVDELFNDFDEIADQLTDLNSFLKGSSKLTAPISYRNLV